MVFAWGGVGKIFYGLITSMITTVEHNFEAEWPSGYGAGLVSALCLL